jgi:drug/metabolite transporter (DMT)-like permease
VQWLVFAALCVIWGFSWIAIKFTLEGFPPFLGAGLRFMLALPLLWLYARAGGLSLTLTRHVVPMVAVTAVLTYGIDYGLVYWGEQYLPPGLTAILFATFPLFTALFSRLLLAGEQPRGRIYLGVALGFLGVAATYSEDLTASGAIEVLLAPVAIVAGAASAALATVLVKRDLLGIHPVSLNLYQLLVGALWLLGTSLAAGEVWLPQGAGLRPWLGVLYLAGIASALAFSLYYWLLRRVSAVAVSTMVFVNPLVAVAFDGLIYGTAVGFNVILGMLLVFTGVFLCRPR